MSCGRIPADLFDPNLDRVSILHVELESVHSHTHARRRIFRTNPLSVVQKANRVLRLASAFSIRAHELAEFGSRADLEEDLLSVRIDDFNLTKLEAHSRTYIDVLGRA